MDLMEIIKCQQGKLSKTYLKTLIQNATHHADVDVLDILNVDSDLLGVNFKYDNNTSSAFGVIPYDIVYRIGETEHEHRVLVKVKPPQQKIYNIYKHLLENCGIDVPHHLDSLLDQSEFHLSNIKEGIFFRDYAKQLFPLIPETLGLDIDEAQQICVRVEKHFPATAYLQAEDNAQNWQQTFFDVALKNLAQVNSLYCKNTPFIENSGYFPNINQSYMEQSTVLWQHFVKFIKHNYAYAIEDSCYRFHTKLVDTISTWYAKVDELPKTLVNGDINPGKIAFIPNHKSQYHFSLFDWECAMISLPQHDYAELLIYTLPDGFDMDLINHWNNIYLDHFNIFSPIELSQADFLQGLKLMIYDLMINRLPLMMMVNYTFQTRKYALQAYDRAWQICKLLHRMDFL